jgi:hypothetical protein
VTVLESPNNCKLFYIFGDYKNIAEAIKHKTMLSYLFPNLDNTESQKNAMHLDVSWHLRHIYEVYPGTPHKNIPTTYWGLSIAY